MNPIFLFFSDKREICNFSSIIVNDAKYKKSPVSPGIGADRARERCTDGRSRLEMCFAVTQNDIKLSIIREKILNMKQRPDGK